MTDRELEGRVALVTGAGRMRGTGHAIAVALAEHGADVVLHGSGSDPSTWAESERAAGWRGLDAVREEVEALGRRALVLQADLRDSAEVDAMVARAESELGVVDLLVNNAAFSRGADRVPVTELGDELWRGVLSVKLDGTLFASRAVARRLIDRGAPGAIVNISSIAGKRAGANAAAYNVSNVGVQMLAATMGRELGPHGITVNALCVGVVDTSRIDDMGRGPELEAYLRQNIPLRRLGTPAEIGEVVAFLAGPGGRFITGQSINVDGGWVTW